MLAHLKIESTKFEIVIKRQGNNSMNNTKNNIDKITTKINYQKGNGKLPAVTSWSTYTTETNKLETFACLKMKHEINSNNNSLVIAKIDIVRITYKLLPVDLVSRTWEGLGVRGNYCCWILKMPLFFKSVKF